MTIEEMCEHKSMRMTDQRRVIAKILDNADDHPDVEELHKRACLIDKNISVATRDIAQKFNNDFGVNDFFKVPEPLIQKEFSRIMSLKDGSKKMSKSEISDLSRINLTDDKDQIINKIKKAKTDPMPMPKTVSELEDRLEAKNLIGIYASLTNSNIEKSVESFIGKNFSEFKEKLSEVLVDKIEPISLEIKKLLNDQTYLNKILQVGAEKANSIASKKIQNIKEIVGF